MSIEEYKEVLDRERNLIRNLNLWDLDYLDMEQFLRMKKLTSHFNYILKFGQKMRTNSRQRSGGLPRSMRSKSRSRSNSRDSLRSCEFLDDLKDRYIQLKHTYYEAVRAGYHIKGNTSKYRYDRNTSGAYKNQLRDQEYRMPFEAPQRSRARGSNGWISERSRSPFQKDYNRSAQSGNRDLGFSAQERPSYSLTYNQLQERDSKYFPS